MNCKDWEERLALYAGGDLPKDEASEVERHLGECPGCQMFSSGLKESQELLLELHREPLAPAHFAAVRARVLAELERGRRPFWRRGWVFGFGAVAAALLVALAVMPPVRSWLSPGRESTPKPVLVMEHSPASNGGLAAGVVVPPGSLGPPVARRVLRVATHQRRTRPKAQTGEPVLIKIVSDDPDVVIYWIAETRGE
jgi:anti-sigma factor RsiW